MTQQIPGLLVRLNEFQVGNPGNVDDAISTFRPGDKVYNCASSTAPREGPYTISSLPAPAQYTLILPSGQPAKGGNVVEEKDLEALDSTEDIR